MTQDEWRDSANPDNLQPSRYCIECSEYTDQVHELLDSFCSQIRWLCVDCFEKTEEDT